jgi:Fe-S oxidoreductase/nitrate reductase gamma subunit
MQPSREIFWNIQYGEILYILGVIVLAIFIYAIYRRYKLWHVGKTDYRSGNIGSRVWAFLVTCIVDGLFHRKFFGLFDNLGHRRFSVRDLKPRELYPGIIHFLIFLGCIVFLLGAFLDFISHYFFDFMHGNFYLGYSVVTDVFGILVLIGVILALIRRYVKKPDRLDNQKQDLIALLLIFFVVLTGFIVEGLRIAATELPNDVDWAPWSPGGYVLALGFSNLSHSALLTWHQVWWWLHMLIAIGAITYVSLYWNRLWHIIIAPLNVFFRPLESKGALVREDFSTVHDLGLAGIEDFTWKQILDLDACVRCGRCQDACPAYASGKPLSPKKVIQDLKDSWLARAPGLVKNKGKLSATNPGNTDSHLSDAITEEVTWECTTCGACMEVCPVYVEHVPKIVGIRRELVEMRAKFPEELLTLFENMEQRSNPWGIAPTDRVKWAAEIETKPFDANETEYLFYVGCAGAFDARNRRVTLALTRILDAAGISWGILGKDEMCCGDSLRRLGNEYVFDLMVKENIKMFEEKGIRKIITQCPHCYSTFKNDYRQYGVELEVIHHTELINKLIKEGKLNLKQTGELGKVVFHDSCYLGRYNGIYEEPRNAITSVTGQAPAEMKRSYERSFCCGAGGGRMWMEESVGRLINVVRVEEALKEDPGTICVCCPYCMTMFEDGLKDEKAADRVRVLDVAEIVAAALE